MIQNIQSSNPSQSLFASAPKKVKRSAYNSAAKTINSSKSQVSKPDLGNPFERFGKSSAKLLRYIIDNFFSILGRAAVLLIPIAVIFKLFGGNIKTIGKSGGWGTRIGNKLNELRGNVPIIRNRKKTPLVAP